MAGDGISVQTSIAQLGNAARTQAKGQQVQQSTTPFSEQLDKKEELRVQRVQETDKAEKRQVDPDSDDRRKKRRQRRERRKKQPRSPAPAGSELGATADSAGEPVENEAAGTDESAERSAALGGLIDTRV